jgi:hypothetical protein
VAVRGADTPVPHIDHRDPFDPDFETAADTCPLRAVPEVGSALEVIDPGESAACLSQTGIVTSA